MATIDSSSLKWLNVVAFLLTVLVNSLAGSTTIFGGTNIAKISDANPTLVTPAGYVFSIWGVIYILLGAFIVFQALPGERGENLQRRIGLLFVMSCLLNIIWLFLWQFEFLSLSLVYMFLLLATLILIYLRLGIGQTTVSLLEKLMAHVPFSVYLGWITIASIANVAVTLVSVNWDGFGISSETWATLTILIALLITLFIFFTRKDIAYGLVIIWALIGISVRQSENQSIVIVTQGSIGILAVYLAGVILLVLMSPET